VDLGADPVQARPALGHVGQGIGEPGPVQRLGADGPDGAAGLAEAVAGQVGGVVEVAAPVGGAALGVPGRLDLGDDPGEALGQGVVDLAGHALALVQGPGRPRLGQQPRLELGVLGRGGLQLGVGLGELGPAATRATPSVPSR
jgi:hypothetical protein